MKLEVEDYCDQKLGSFEIILERTQQIVAQGRSRLQGNPLEAAHADSAQSNEDMPDPDGEAGDGFFDQDIS